VVAAEPSTVAEVLAGGVSAVGSVVAYSQDSSELFDEFWLPFRSRQLLVTSVDAESVRRQAPVLEQVNQ
jgi:hypothetical protein